MTPDMVIIVRETNRKALEITLDWNDANSNVPPKVWRQTNEDEIYAFFELLLFAGLFKHSAEQRAMGSIPSRHL